MYFPEQVGRVYLTAMELLQLYNHLPITIEKDKDGIYIVGCTALGFYTYGKSAEEGLNNLDKVVEICRAGRP